LLLATLAAGVILFAMGAARMGQFVEYVPYPVTTGFTAGIAVSLRKNFSMTLHSAAPRPRGNRLLHCNIIYCNAKWQIELRH